MLFTRNRRRGRLAALTGAAALIAAYLVASAAPPAQAADESITVDYGVTGGSPTYRASGWIYGMTEDASGPPDRFFEEVNFQYMRAGGAQLDNPGGWVSGRYDRRWDATEAQLMRTRSLGAEFIILPHDLWGADGTSISRYPGDGGDWSDYDAFLDRLIADVAATGQPVMWDLWNEPDLALFWDRPQSQYLELWERSYHRIREAFPNHLIVGPSAAHSPHATNGWWDTYLNFIRDTGTVPDVLSWHTLPNDPVSTVAAMNSMLDARGIPRPDHPYQINEYASPDEQNPGDGSWYIARLERAGADGLRANWGSGGGLHDNLADLLIRDSSGRYQPKGEWWVYRYYATQTGTIANVTPSQAYDAFATTTSGEAKILVGGGGTTGNIAVDIENLDQTSGIVQDNRVRVLAERIPYNNGGAVPGPVTVTDTVVTLSDGGTTVNLPHDNADDSFTVTLLPPDGPPAGDTVEITARHSGKCLDVAGVSTADGANVYQYGCHGGGNQQWELRDAGEGYVEIVAAHSGKCLDVAEISTADGANVHQYTCWGGENQQWELRDVGAGYFEIVARHSGKCLDVEGVSTGDSANVYQYACLGGENQQFRLESGPQ